MKPIEKFSIDAGEALIVIPEPGETVVHECERSLYCDVDETLVFVDYPADREANTIEFNAFGYTGRILPHWEHVELIKQFRLRGIAVFVWSHGGVNWASAVVEALGLVGWVHVLPKATDWLLDDKEPKEWIGRRFHLDESKDKSEIGKR